MSFLDLWRNPRAGIGDPVVNMQNTPPFAMRKTSDTEAEIVLYGNIVSKRPVKNYLTGQEDDGNYIVLSEFMAELEKIKDVSALTVRIHSAGGNAYDAIVMHNKLKELKATVTVIVEGIAMSGGSLIMCAADTVKVNASSIVMIHKCWKMIWDALNADELRKLADSNDAVDRAQAAIYCKKTGLSEEEILKMMSNETYMTGREAVEKGFADEVIEGEAPDIAASADRRTLFYDGQPVWTSPSGSLPMSICVPMIPSAAADEINKKTPENAGNEGGIPMAKTLDELRREYPDLTDQLEREAKASVAGAATAQSVADAVREERERIHAIDEIAPNILDKKMVEEAKYGNPCSAQELAFNAMKAQATQAEDHLNNAAEDAKKSGVKAVGTAPAPTDEPAGDSPESVMAQAKADVEKFKNML